MLFIEKCYYSGVIFRISFNEDFNGFGRQVFFNFIRPFDEAPVATEEIIFITHVEQLSDLFDPVKIKMVNFPNGRLINIYQREGGAVHCVGYAQLPANRLYQGCFSSTQIAVKCINPTVLMPGNQSFGHIPERFYTFTYNYITPCHKCKYLKIIWVKEQYKESVSPQGKYHHAEKCFCNN
jgi:hypothetical protein